MHQSALQNGFRGKQQELVEPSIFNRLKTGTNLFRANLIFVEFRVGAVTVRRIVSVFALAEERVAVFCCHEAFGSEARACVRAIAEGLIAGTTAGAEHILFACFQCDFFGLVICNDGIAHKSSPRCW